MQTTDLPLLPTYSPAWTRHPEALYPRLGVPEFLERRERPRGNPLQPVVAEVEDGEVRAHAIEGVVRYHLQVLEGHSS